MASKEYEKKQFYDDLYNEAYEAWYPWMNEAAEDTKFYVGNQYSDNERLYLEKEGRTAFVYNKIKRAVDNALGYQIRNRMGMACEPQEGSDLETSDIFSELLTWNMQQQNGYWKWSKGVKGGLITGLNLTSLYMDYTQDPVDGDILIQREPFASFLIDPLWMGDPSFEDCRYILRRRYLRKDRAASLLPDKRKEILKMDSMAQDGKFSFMYISRELIKNSVSVDECWHREFVSAKLLVNRLTGESRIFQGSPKALKAFLESPATVPLQNGQVLMVPFGEFVDVTETTTQEIRLNTYVNGILMDEAKKVFGINKFPFVPNVGYYLPEHDNYAEKLFGIPRVERDPQRDYNRQRSKVLDYINSQASTGYMYKDGAVKNPLDLFKTGQGVNIVLDEDAQPNDIQKISPNDIPSNWFNYLQIADNIGEFSGVTNENLGFSEMGSQVSGTAIKLRQASGTTTLAEIYDNSDISFKMLGKLQMEMMQANWSPDKVARIIGREPTQEFYQNNFGKYDCIVKETNLTDTQRNLAWADALQARAILGDVIPKEFLIEMYPGAEKSKLLKAFEAQEAEQKAQQEKLNEQEVLGKRLANAEVVSKLSLASERRARMAADIGLAKNRMADAFQDRTNAVLNQAKTITELQGVQQQQLEEAIRFIFELEERAQNQTLAQTTDNLNRSLQEVAITDEMANPQPAPQIAGGNDGL